MAQPIQTRLKLLFSRDGKDVTEDLGPDLLSFTYVDKETAEADEVTITLKDPDGTWAGRWRPDGGEMVRAFIQSGDVEAAKRELYCGRFFVDSLRASGAPRTCEIKAVSIPMNTPIRRKPKTRAWEKKSLKAIAQSIAKAAKVDLLFDSEVNPTFDRVDQSAESDLKFLLKLCEENGLSLKLTDEKIVIFDQASYESKKPVETIVLGESPVLSWDFESAQSESYKSVTVNYRDPKTKKKSSAGKFDLNAKPSGELIDPGQFRLDGSAPAKTNKAVFSYTYTDPDADENGQEFVLKKRAKSAADAKRLAKAKMRQLNLRRVTGSMTVIGDTRFVAGVVVAVEGFGSFDGNFVIEQADHSVSGSGYTTALSLRRVSVNY